MCSPVGYAIPWLRPRVLSRGTRVRKGRSYGRSTRVNVHSKNRSSEMKLDDDDLLTENLRKLACGLRVGRKLWINFYDSIYVASIPLPTSPFFYRRLKIGTNRLRVYRFPDFRYAYNMDNESYRFVGLQPLSHSCSSNRSFCVVSEKYAGRSHARRLALTRTLSATTFESTASMPPPSAAVMNSCVLYASSGHFFRRGNGGSKVGPETNKRGCLRSFI